MKSNMLGNIVAENDADMLDRAFYETPDYKSLLESNDRCVVVGRRGTGKSALVHRLNAYWWKKKKTFVISLAPEEAQVIGLRGTFSIFGNNFVHVKAASKISWRYALYMEIISKISNHYKLRKFIESYDLTKYLKEWGHPEVNFASKLRLRLKNAIDKSATPEENIADLSSNLNLDVIEEKLLRIIKDTDYEIVVLIDRLDEGYTPDQLGVALADGFVQANIDLNSKFSPNIRGLVFLRDNMYRSISINDPDFTRNIEGQVLRLHWDEYGLFNMVCNRLRIAKNSSYENNSKLWNLYTARELKGRDGFRLALRLTLYRPRDILVLLNNAFLNSSSQERKEIVPDDIELSAKSISENRFHDLIKEYDTIFPALQLFTSSFSSSSAELSINKAREIINPIISRDDHDINYQRDVAIFENADQVLQRLYGIGFLGIKDINSSSYVFVMTAESW